MPEPLGSRRFLLVAAAAALFLCSQPARGAGGNYVFVGGSDAARAEVRSALDASSFDWGLVSQEISIRIAPCGCAGARAGEIVLDERLLSALPYGRGYTWGIVQHEYAHQVGYLALDSGKQAIVREVLGGADWCYEARGLGHDDHACERFASSLAWAYWPSPDNSQRNDAALGPRRFKALLGWLLDLPSAKHPGSALRTRQHR